MEKTKIAVFIDVENLTQWVKDDGAERLMSDIGSSGQIIVRRAYGVWSRPNLVNFQAPLNRLGFELIHSYHPVSGKNSADIQLTVDVMDHALRLPDVEWFVLATGDSDFSPLFRRLREMGKEVIGVGPRSPLSESVKTSCSRYIYTDPVESGALSLEFDDAANIVEQVLASKSEPMPLPHLKQALVNVDSAFDEKAMGFGSFSAFLRAIESIELSLADGSNTIWLASLLTPEPAKDLLSASKERYQSLLRKKHWRSVPLDLLELVHTGLITLEPMEKPQLVEALLTELSVLKRDLTAADIRKALSILFKAQLLLATTENGGEKLWFYRPQTDYIELIDTALTKRILAGCEDSAVQFDQDVLHQMLFGRYSRKDLEGLVTGAHDAMSIKEVAQSA